MATSVHAWRRRLDYRSEETIGCIERYLKTDADDYWRQEQAIMAARALWSIALRIPQRDVATLLDGVNTNA